MTSTTHLHSAAKIQKKKILNTDQIVKTLIKSCSLSFRIKIHAISNLQETVSILTVPDQSGIKAMDWSVDGQLISASTTQGSIYVFVTKMSVLSTISFPRIAILSSLAEVSIYNYSLDKIKTPHCVMPLEIEPSVIAIGPFHFACGMNNHAWFYDLSRPLDDSPTPLNDREYIAEINDLKLNAKYCAALIGGRVSLHPVCKITIKLTFSLNFHFSHIFID